MQEVHGSMGAWQHLVEILREMKTGECKIDWENDRVIFVQVFCCHLEAGHWSLLIIDRTRPKLGALISFDSLPDYFPDTLSNLKSMLTGSLRCQTKAFEPMTVGCLCRVLQACTLKSLSRQIVCWPVHQVQVPPCFPVSRFVLIMIPLMLDGQVRIIC
jgi:hypothetical protein